MRWAACLVLVSAPLTALAQESKSALESDPAGWVDLVADAGLKEWRRVPIPPTGKLRDKSPWSVTDGKVIRCDGVGIHEMLVWDKEVGSGIFHLEWRFQKIEGKKGYNSGVYVRNSSDGAIWHQAQVGEKNVGYLFGNTLMDGKPGRFKSTNKLPQRGKGAGEWNTFEIACKGKDITLWVNGAVTSDWNCEVPKGYFGLEAEGFVIEFRNIKLKKLD